MRYFYSAIQKLTQWFWSRKNGAKIFMFHSVSDNKEAWAEQSIWISKRKFCEFIDALQDGGKKFISVNELQNCFDDNSVCITFDDVFNSAVTNAIPYLINKRIPFCLFISESCVDREGFISGEHIRQLKDNSFCTIAYHSKNHLLMRKLSKEQVISEIDCTGFEEKYGLKVENFAFPFGSVYACDRYSVKKACEKYKLVFSTIRAPYSKSWQIKKKNYLPRINVNEDTAQKLLSGK